MNKKENPTDTENQEVKETLVDETPANEQQEKSTEKKKSKRGKRGGKNSAQEETVEETASETSNETPKEEQPAKDELGDMKDKYLRLRADFDNFRKRTAKERLDLMKMASQDMVVAILPVLDDFERAIKIAEQEDNDEQVSEGIRLVYNKFSKILEQKGVTRMETNGEAFDADKHEAITRIPAPTEDLKGKVVDTVETGYMLHDKIIRFPKVVVGQ